MPMTLRSKGLSPIVDPTTHHDVSNDRIRVAWIFSPKVAFRLVNEQLNDRSSINIRSAAEIAIQS
jgi:hypothetical protein